MRRTRFFRNYKGCEIKIIKRILCTFLTSSSHIHRNKKKTKVEVEMIFNDNCDGTKFICNVHLTEGKNNGRQINCCLQDLKDQKYVCGILLQV